MIFPSINAVHHRSLLLFTYSCNTVYTDLYTIRTPANSLPRPPVALLTAAESWWHGGDDRASRHRDARPRASLPSICRLSLPSCLPSSPAALATGISSAARSQLRANARLEPVGGRLSSAGSSISAVATASPPPPPGVALRVHRSRNVHDCLLVCLHHCCHRRLRLLPATPLQLMPNTPALPSSPPTLPLPPYPPLASPEPRPPPPHPRPTPPEPSPPPPESPISIATASPAGARLGRRPSRWRRPSLSACSAPLLRRHAGLVPSSDRCAPPCHLPCCWLSTYIPFPPISLSQATSFIAPGQTLSPLVCKAPARSGLKKSSPTTPTRQSA